MKTNLHSEAMIDVIEQTETLDAFEGAVFDIIPTGKSVRIVFTPPPGQEGARDDQWRPMLSMSYSGAHFYADYGQDVYLNHRIEEAEVRVSGGPLGTVVTLLEIDESPPTTEDLANADLLDQMAGIYPGDPDGALARDSCELRQIPYEPPVIIVTYEDE